MTDGKSNGNLDEAMRLLLERELTAGLGSPKPPGPAGLASDSKGDLEADVLRLAATALRMPEDQLDPTENLANFGVDSIAITEIMASISRFFGIAVAPTTFFEAKHLNDLARILKERHAKAITAYYEALATSRRNSREIEAEIEDDETVSWLKRHRAKRPQTKTAKDEPDAADAPIAIVAMEGMFPQSPDLAAFEAHLRNGDDCIEVAPPNRWDWRAVQGDPRKGNFTQVKSGGFVPGHDLFDAAFFNISAREAELIDPQHRLFMQCVWSLIEKSGHAPGSLSGKKVGVFLGVNLQDYANMANRLGLADAQRLTGLGHAFCPNRISFLLDIHGPSQVVDTACSSSLVALHRAVMSIRHEGCEMAIAGGANLMLNADQHVLFSKVGMLAADGRCKTFSKQADGYGRADGVGAVLLKPLDKARQDGDPILGVILSSVEHHGGAAASLTAPNPQSQARLIVEAHRQAGVDPRSVGYVECHGTGTPLGDPAEIEGLKAAFAQLYAERGLPPPAEPGCALGSVKSNIGHCETAAGVAGLIKTLLSMRSGVLYRSLHCDEPNPLIELNGSPFYLLNEARPWTRPIIDGVETPRRAAISSFGAGGTNAHVVIEEYRADRTAPAKPGARPQVFPLSAHNEESLRRSMSALLPFVRQSDFDDLAFTLQMGRDARKCRAAFVAADAEELAGRMRAFLNGEKADVAQGVVEKRKQVPPISAKEDAGKAAAWAAGAIVDWSARHEAGRRRLALPGVCFTGKRYWLAPDAPRISSQGFVLTPVGADRWQAELRGDEFYLKDHRLGDRPILPGVAYLELARSAAKQAGLAVSELRNVVWIQPLAVTEPTRIEISLIRDAEGKAQLVEIASLAPNAPKKLHAQIRLGVGDLAPFPRADLAALKAACPQGFAAQQVYAAFARMGLNYGPAHRAIAQLAVGRDQSGHAQVLAKLVLPACVSSSLSDFGLHPSLMDGAFQAAIGMALSDGDAPSEAALPFAIDGVEMHAPCLGEIWVHIRQTGEDKARNAQRLDLVMMDENGAPLVLLKGFTTRLAKNDKGRPLAFQPVWRAVESAKEAPAIKTGTILLAGGASDVARMNGLLSGWNRRSVEMADGASLDATFPALAQAVLAELQSPTRSGPLWVVLPDGDAACALAGIAGLLRSAAQERAGFEGGVLLVPANADRNDLEAVLAAPPPGVGLLRLDNGLAQRESWEPVAFKDAPPPWENGKTYLVTGGLGGLGKQLATAILATAPEATVVLAGRSAPAQSDLDWLKGHAGRMLYRQADLSDASAVDDLVVFIRSEIGPLSGVIHAAGVIQDSRLDVKTPEQLAAVLAPKVAGTVNLDRSLGDQALDFFILFSSLSGVLGGAGQADYAAANAFLDGFALWRETKRRQKTVSIAWPFWKDGGMAMDGDTQALMTSVTGLAPLETADGLAALAFALAQGQPRLMIAAGDAEKVRKTVAGQARPAPSPNKPAVSQTALKERLLAHLTASAANQLKAPSDELDPKTELTEYGFDSIGFTQFANSLNDALGLELTPTVFFEHQTLAKLAQHLSQSHAAFLAERLGVAAAPAEQTQESPAPTPARPPLAAAPPATSEDVGVAIIGMSCHFPKAGDAQEFWRNLEAGVDGVSEIPPERWNWRDYWGDPLSQPGRCDVRWGGFIDGAGAFDAAFFGLSAPEARMTDPQQRLLLTQAWRVMEDAGYAPSRLSGSQTGVFVGTADTGYGRLLAEAQADIEGYSMTGLAPSLGPNRISYHFNFHGPSVAVETACSSALVAIHRAAEAIRHGQCETAIAGGVNLLLLPDSFIGFAKAGMLAKDGRCKPFSAMADGYARGEGVGLVFLKRLDAARRDGDRILAVIRASGENHGGHASSLTAPNPKAQANLLRGVYRQAGFDPRTVGYIEAHGTGTPLGDPIEIEALSAAFADLSQEAETRFGPAEPQDCAVGSVKSNIGHLELAAGAAGLIKTLLQIEHGKLVKTLHCEQLNPYLKLEGGPFRIAAANAPWPRKTDALGNALPRRAGVSSFGFGGSNAHVVVEEFIAPPDAPPDAPPSQTSAPQLFVLSAHSPEALTQWARLLRDHVASNAAPPLATIAHTLQTARDAMEHRLAFVAARPSDVLARLDSFLNGRQDAALHQGRVKPNRAAMAVLENDVEFRNAANGLPARGNADGLLELWVRGFDVDWNALRGSARPKRVRLPCYPLAKTEYWVKRDGQPAALATPPAPPPPPEPIQAQADAADPLRHALEALTDIAARTLEVDPRILDADTELGEFGFDSITMTSFASKVNAELNLSLTPADFFEFATLARLAKHIAGSIEKPARRPPAAVAVAVADTVIKAPRERDDDPIVITGFSCSFPKAPDGDAFWRNLIEGRDCISEIPPDRWDWREYDGDPKIDAGKTNIRWGGFIEGVFEFDPLFFGISPREAKLMDPQQRLVMTHVWKAIEDCGHAPRSLAGRKAGLFVGTSSSGYRDVIGDDTGAEGYVATGAVPSVGPNRISFFLDWHGPSEPVETACSSSLVALHRAIQAMRAGDCDMAVAGGVNTIVTPEAHINFAKAGMLSLDGRCKTFSAQANGYVRGEGVGVFVLKRQSEAERDGDPILAVVKGSAVGHGGRANSLTAPNTQAQADLLREAQARAGVDPATIGYIETHGTGTALGDPVEINALKAVFKGRSPSEAEKAQGAGCGLASVKSNIGHLELAAGAASVIKALLQFKHRRLAPSLHCAEINPYIDLRDSPLRIVREAQPWRPILNEDGAPLPLRAGVSSFGFGGVNAHVILEEYKDARPRTADRPGPCVIPLSARDGERLKDQARNLLAFIEAGNVLEEELADLAYTLQVGRDAMRERLAFVAADLGEARRKLVDYLNGDAQGLLTGRLAAGHKATATLNASLSLHELAQGWARGDDVDWQSLHPRPRRRLRLPTYPFAREIYHMKAAFAGSAQLARPAGEGPFAFRLKAADFFLRDHLVRGVPILPGAMGLELARQAFAKGRPFAPVALSRVVWLRPLRLPSGAVTATIPLTASENDACEFRLLSEGAGNDPHMQGRIEALGETAKDRIKIDELRGRAVKTLSSQWLYDAFARLGLEYGPAFQPIQEIHVGQEGVLARLRLPRAASEGDFGLNPSMLDGAFQAILGLFYDQGGDEAALPFALDRLEAMAPTGEEMWAHVRKTSADGGVLKLDIDLADGEGFVLVRLQGFSLRLMKTAPATRPPKPDVMSHLAALVAKEAALPLEDVEAESPLEAYGIDSVMIVRLTDALEQDFGPLPKTLFFEHRTLAALATYFESEHANALVRLFGSTPESPPPAEIPPLAQDGMAQVRPRNAPIAIIGMSGRYPKADDLEAFWRNLEAGLDCIGEIPPERWDGEAFYDPRPGQPGKTNGKWGGFIDGVDRFDPLFFNISPREAEYIDPQERLFLQCAWETLEDAGYTRANLAKPALGMDGGDVGVFVGLMYQEYQLYGAQSTALGQPMALNGSAASIANRVSYFCGFHGPSLTLDSMCSSSLTAIHLACQSLRNGECQVALAGGVNLSLHPNKYLGLAQGRFMSSTGRCESFGKGGDGYVPGEGVGAVLLKPLDQAVADGDRIWGVIRATALNHGGKTNGYTVPNPAAQASVIGRAMDMAGLSPDDIGYVEAHGTGTSLGDPIEIAALSKAYRERGASKGKCAIGSVKSNIGHCESAAGMAGLAKVLLQFKHRKLAPSLHAETLNPGIDFAASPFAVQRALAEWKVAPGRKRVAGLSSFGAGGANAHVILEEYAPTQAPLPPAQEPRIFPLSARDAERLTEAIRRLRQALDGLSESDLPSVAFVLQEGREAFEERLAIVANGMAELKDKLDLALGRADPALGVHRGRVLPSRDRLRPESDSLHSLAAAWVGGSAIDWRALAQGRPRPRRIALPTYPFAAERYWAPGSVSVAVPVQAQAQAPLPLLFAPLWKQSPPLRECAVPQRHVVILREPFASEAERISSLMPQADLRVLQADAQPIAERYRRLALDLLETLQGLIKERLPSALLQVVVPLQDEEALLEGLAGLLRTAQLECPALRCQMIGVDQSSSAIGEILAAERESRDGDIRYVTGQRRVRQWREVSAKPGAASWKDGGVYLVTGGAGGIGLHLCQAIAASAVNASLWLTGRSAPSPETLDRLKRVNARIEYRQADVADGQATRRLISEIVARHGRLDGVVHAAGLTRDALLVRKTLAEASDVLSPKVLGAINLDRATAHLDLDFMLLFASASGALGNPGQGDYAAANGFMDAFAAHRNKLAAKGLRQGRCLSLDWPYWQDGGMRMDGQTIAAMERVAGARPLATPAAMAALNAAMAAKDEEQILILAGDHDRLRKLLNPEPAKTETASPPPAESRELAAFVTDCFAQVLKIAPERLAPQATLDRFGMDSVSALEVVAALERRFGPLPQTILFEFPSIDLLCAELAKNAPPPQPEKPQPLALQETAGDIAVIAVAGRYPGADTVEEFWKLLAEGRDCVGEVPADRWDPNYSSEKGKPGTSHCKWGGFLNDVDCFDADFFGYTPRMAKLADPEERLFLETVWRLLERAGHTRPMLRQRYEAKVGVFVGAMFHGYGAVEADADSRALLSLSSYAAIANRTSFFFDLQGPSVAIDSMCSSGLQAVHQACQSLRFKECRLAIAGGVNLSLLPGKYQGLSRFGLLGSRPDSRAFADGDGYLPAEGVGAVLLKPLDDALRDGDDVLAVIKGSNANHGGHSAGFGVPSAEAQARLIEEDLRRSGIDARSISYVEAAASGSNLGDAIEIRALTRAFRAFTADSGFCAIGSVKTNMGHAEAASGMAQLTKVLLQLRHARLVPSLQPRRMNPSIDFKDTPFYPQWQGDEWRRPVVAGKQTPRRAAISSFGAGGSNVHLILEEAPPRDVGKEQAQDARPRRFPVSARTPEQLQETLRRLADFVESDPALDLARLSCTLRLGREPMEQAVQLVAANREELAKKLRLAIDGHRIFEQGGDDDEPALPPLILPEYPFAKQRHRIEAKAAPDLANGSDPLSVVLECLARELGKPLRAIDADQDFLALGVDSMTALRLGYEVEERLGVALNSLALADHPTPRALARFLLAEANPAKPPPSPRQSASDQIPLSEGQKGLWVVQSLYPDQGTYNVPLAFRLSGIDHKALSQACRWLLQAYPILTARLLADAQPPVLETKPPQAPLRRVKVPKGMDPLDFARSQAQRPFDMATEPLSRFELLHGKSLGDGHEILLITVHHMVFDGASAWIAAQALWQAYERFASKQDAPAFPQAADFADFVAWEQDFMRSPQGHRQLAFWRDGLAGDLPVLDLPSERPARADGVIEGQSLERRLPPAFLARAKRAAAKLGVTPASFFLGVLFILLYRHSGQQDILVGVPSLRRPERRFENGVGYFVNMLALRQTVDGGDLAQELLTRIHRRMIEALSHGDYPFAAIARGLGGGLDGAPPYQISYAYQNFPMAGDAGLSDSNGQAHYLAEIRQQGDGPFGLELYEENGGLRLVAGYDGARFDASGIERLLDRFVLLTKSACDNPETPIGGFNLLSAAERKRLHKRKSAQGSSQADRRLLPDLVAQRARKRPKSVAVTAGDEEISYRRLVRRANRLARHLRACKVKKGDAVAVLMERNIDAIAALLATMTASAVWVPLDADAPDQRLSAMLADCEAKIVLCAGALADRAKKIAPPKTRVVDVERDAQMIAKLSASRPKSRPAPKDAAYVIYTSGSTGAPKGVVVSHRAIAEHCQLIAQHYELRDEDAVLQFAPHVVDTALEQILPTLISGARLVMRTGMAWPPHALLDLLREQRISVADLPPAYLRDALLSWRGEDFPQALPLRLCVVGGEALPADTARLWLEGPLKSARLVNAYGPTEATITCLAHEVKEVPRNFGVPIGRPLPGTLVLILDRDGNPVPEGVIGELLIGGDRLAIGYRNRPDLTQEKFVAVPWGGAKARFYRTGDLASFLPGGNGIVAFHGRADQQIKIRGFRVELDEIKAAMDSFGLKESAVAAHADGRGDQSLIAYVVPLADGFDEEALRRHMATRLPAHMLPATFIRLDALPMTRSGKLDRQALPPRAEQGPSDDQPRNAWEKDLRQIWALVLGVDAANIGVHDDFQRLGGHSLLWIRLLSEIGRAFRMRPSTGDFLAARTIAEQAGVLRRILNGGAGGSDFCDDEANRVLVPLRPMIAGAASQAPLFLVHPVAGGVSCYLDLARRLDPDLPVYGLQIPGADDPSAPTTRLSLPELASRYLNAVRQVQERGPYRLGGWSMGGVLAYEMARQLRQEGQEIALLCLIESYAPDLLRRLEQADLSQEAFRRDFERDVLGPSAAALADNGQGMSIHGNACDDEGARRLERLFSQYRANREALTAYEPAACDAALTLIRAAQHRLDDETCGWGKLALGGATCFKAPGDHYTVLSEPGLGTCADILNKALANCRNPS